jgi:PAS domain S-box-containing protein
LKVLRKMSYEAVKMPDTNMENRPGRSRLERNRQISLREENLPEKKTAEDALLASEKRYRRLFESAKDGILILDADTGKIADVNPFLLELLGYSYDALYGQHIWELGVFKDIAASKEAFRTLQSREYIRYEHLPLQTCDGRTVEVEFVSNIYLVDSIRVIQCNIRDITARRQTERALEESGAKMRNILDNIGIGVALISTEMEVLELNLQMREWFPGVNPGQRPLCYRAFNSPQRGDLCDNCPTVMTLRDGTVHEETMQIERAGGMRTCRIVSSPILSASGEVSAVIEMVEDITEKISLESQFRHAQKMEAVGQLAGGMAHDFNNMLAMIIGYAELALDKVNPTGPIQDDLEAILRAANRSTEITRKLLAFARKQTIAPRVIDLNKTLAEMLRTLQRLIGEEIELTWQPGTNLWPIRMDPAQLDQILVNLCVNARDAIGHRGRITIETDRVTFDKTYCHAHPDFVPGDFVLLRVSDDGCGMDKKIRDRLFEPFFTTKGVGRGTGLGLSTIYGIVKQNQGLIRVSSKPGKGTTVRIFLQCHEGDTVIPRKNIHTESPKSHGETILVVEDEAVILNLIRTMLERQGYTVLTADTRDEAIRLAEAHISKINMLLTDVIMPEMNGRELAERLILLKPNLKVLFMSGYTANVIAHRGVLENGVHFIQKPFSMKNLALRIHEILGQE